MGKGGGDKRKSPIISHAEMRNDYIVVMILAFEREKLNDKVQEAHIFWHIVQLSSMTLLKIAGSTIKATKMARMRMNMIPYLITICLL